jgi:hypothetical protein
MDGHAVTTAAGLAPSDDLHPAQESLVEHFGFQCGFCTAGMAVTASTLSAGDLPDLDRRMKGNLCRCTGYRAIRESITASVLGPVRPHGADVRAVSARACTRRPRSVSCRASSPTRSTPTSPERSRCGFSRARTPTRASERSTRPKPRGSRGSSGCSRTATTPERRYSTARHEHATDDSDDTRLLDDVVRHVGQRVAAVVAETARPPRRRAGSSASSTRSSRRLRPRARPHPGAAGSSSRPHAEDRVEDAARNVIASIHGGYGDVETALAASAAPSAASGARAREPRAARDARVDRVARR